MGNDAGSAIPLLDNSSEEQKFLNGFRALGDVGGGGGGGGWRKKVIKRCVSRPIRTMDVLDGGCGVFVRFFPLGLKDVAEGATQTELKNGQPRMESKTRRSVQVFAGNIVFTDMALSFF